MFGGLLALTGLGAALAWQAGGNIDEAYGVGLGAVDRPRLAFAGTFLFVLAGWVVSLCLHEFGHAFAAYRGGDHTVAQKGYLTLDPRKYVDPGLSLVLPILMVLIGGLGLPGGAVWINNGLLRSPKTRSIVSLAGPFANLVCGVVLCIPFRVGLLSVDRNFDHYYFACAVAFLAVLQFVAMFLNLLPIPGLDGFGAIEPYLSHKTLARIAPIRQYSFLILFLVIFRARGLTNFLWEKASSMTHLLGVPRALWVIGHELFKLL